MLQINLIHSVYTTSIFTFNLKTAKTTCSTISERTCNYIWQWAPDIPTITSLLVPCFTDLGLPRSDFLIEESDTVVDT